MSTDEKKPSPGGEKYALWLKPENEVFHVMKKIIVSLAGKYGAPQFEPHLTVVGSIHYPVEKIKDIVKKTASESEPMTLYLKEADFRDSLYQSLFVHIAPNDALLALRERFLTELKLEHKPYMPHMSLLYKHLDSEEKIEIIRRTGRRFDLVFIPDKLYLVRTTGQPDDWKEIMHAPLASK